MRKTHPTAVTLPALILTLAMSSAAAQEAGDDIDCEDEANEDNPICIALQTDAEDDLAGALGLPAGTEITNFVPIGLGALGVIGLAAAGGGGGSGGTDGTTSTTGTVSTLD
ncbi:MAG: hypothetical protein AAFP13_03775 [Pseudomonadota bacterium]